MNQQQEIADLRKRNNCTPVTPKDPKWWLRRVRWVTGGQCRLFTYRAQGMQALRGSPKIFDHYGTSVDEHGNEVFVTEPYDSHRPELVRRVALIANCLGVHYRILPPSQSWHYPNHTLRIEFAECQHHPVCRDCKTMEQLKSEAQEAHKQGVMLIEKHGVQTH